jgi:hypothetical protein
MGSTAHNAQQSLHCTPHPPEVRCPSEHWTTSRIVVSVDVPQNKFLEFHAVPLNKGGNIGLHAGRLRWRLWLSVILSNSLTVVQTTTPCATRARFDNSTQSPRQFHHSLQMMRLKRHLAATVPHIMYFLVCNLPVPAKKHLTARDSSTTLLDACPAHHTVRSSCFQDRFCGHIFMVCRQRNAFPASHASSRRGGAFAHSTESRTLVQHILMNNVDNV